MFKVTGQGPRAAEAVALQRPVPSIPSRVGGGLWTFARRKPLGAICAVILAVFVLTSAFATVVAPHDPLKQNGGRTIEGSSREFWMGTDHLGRDIFSRILYGAKISITVGIAAVCVGTSMGSTLGLISGYRGGKLDLYIQRLVDAWIAFPGLILTLTLVSMLGASLINVCIAIGIASIPGTSRLVRSTVLAVKQNDFILAARALGAGDPRIVIRHVLPNVMAPIIIAGTVSLGGAILAESTLSFLGMGVPPPAPTWGGMLSREGREFMLIQPGLALWPGFAITSVVMAFNLFGDALRDVWDPRLRGSK